MIPSVKSRLIPYISWYLTLLNCRLKNPEFDYQANGKGSFMDGENKIAETALKNTAESVSALTTRIEESVKRAQLRLNELQSAVVDKTKYAARSTDAYVHEKPWSAVCTAVSVGFVIGLIVGRR